MTAVMERREAHLHTAESFPRVRSEGITSKPAQWTPFLRPGSTNCVVQVCFFIPLLGPEIAQVKVSCGQLIYSMWAPGK